MQPQLPLGRWALFRNGEFFRLWGIGAMSSTIRWLEMLAIGVVVFDLTGSPFQVALMSILRMLPLAFFGALVGALAERLNHRKMLVSGIVVMIGVSAVLATLSKTGHIQLWHIAVGVFVSGMFWVLDYSVRKTLLGAAVDGDSVGHAMSLDTVSNNGTRMLGPILGGMFLQWVGLTGVYVFAAVGYIGAILCALALSSTIGRSEQKGRGVISAIGQSLPLLKSHPLLAGILMVTVVFNLWGFPFISMIPVIGKEILVLNSFYVGLLMSAEGCGALIGALLIAGTGQSRHYRKLYICGLGFYLVKSGNFQEAEVILEELKNKTLQYESTPYLTANIQVLSAMIEYKKGRLSESRKLMNSLEKLAVVNRKMGVERWLRGMIEMASGNMAEAVVALDSIQTPGSNQVGNRNRLPVSDYIQSLYRLAVLEQELGELGSAKEHFVRFLEYWGDADVPLPSVDDAKQRLSELDAR